MKVTVKAVLVLMLAITGVIMFAGANLVVAAGLEDLKERSEFSPINAESVKTVEIQVPKASYDDAWARIKLYAADGTSIEVNYLPSSASEGVTADPVRITINTPGLFPAWTKARVVLINYFDSNWIAPGTIHSQQELDMEPAGRSTLVAYAKGITLMRPEVNFRQEIAVVIDGKWLVDPVTGLHNFKFKMTW